MINRGYNISNLVWDKIISLNKNFIPIQFEDIFYDWHNKRYLEQCYYNLLEKYDCG